MKIAPKSCLQQVMYFKTSPFTCRIHSETGEWREIFSDVEEQLFGLSVAFIFKMQELS